MASPYGVKTLIKRTFAGRFTLARLTRRPVVGRLVHHLLFRDDDIVYLPRDTVVPVRRPLDPPQDLVLPSQVLESLILRARHHWIMNFCICRESAGCRHYPVDLGCLFMGAAAMGINPSWGRPVGRQEALDHARACRERGLVHLVGRNRLDAVWLNVRPVHRLLTVCHCCPCCCLWRILPRVAPDIGRKVARLPGVRMAVTQRCNGCGACARSVCFVDAIQVQDGRAVIGAQCRACGRCAEVCPRKAIELQVTEPAYLGRSLERILGVVDLT